MTGEIKRRARGEPFKGWKTAEYHETGLYAGGKLIKINADGKLSREKSGSQWGGIAKRAVGQWLVHHSPTQQKLSLSYAGHPLTFSGGLDVDMAVATASYGGENWLFDRLGNSQAQTWSPNSLDLKHSLPLRVDMTTSEHRPALMIGRNAKGEKATLNDQGKWFQSSEHLQTIRGNTASPSLLIELGEQTAVKRRIGTPFSYAPTPLSNLIHKGRFHFDDPISIEVTKRHGIKQFFVTMKGGSHEMYNLAESIPVLEEVTYNRPSTEERLIRSKLSDRLRERVKPHMKLINEQLGTPWMWLPAKDRVFVLGSQSAGWVEDR